MRRSAGGEHNEELVFEQFPTITRRRLLTAAGGSAAALAFLLDQPTAASASPATPPRIREHPFTLGIASGDPLPSAVVIWTRLAPEPLDPLGGLPPEKNIPVRWQIVSDEHFSRNLREGTAIARGAYAYSVHVDVQGLRPSTEYYYRFAVGDWISDTGRTRTAPLPGARIDELTFAVASCNSFGAGWFTSAGHLADEDVDLIFFLGDYIYEYPLTAGRSLRVDPPQMPSIFDTSTVSLSRYRLQYAAYKSDPNLVAAHRDKPWILTWDDHDVVNDYYGDKDPDDPANADALARRANAYRAFWEHMPLRRTRLPTGPDARLYRRFDFGRLARFNVLDARQYRSPQVSDGKISDSPQRRDPDRTMLGGNQEKWFFKSLQRSHARWNIVPQGVLMSRLDSDPSDDMAFAPGGWDGYQASQQRVCDIIAETPVQNVVVLTGDIHRNYALDIKADFDDSESAVIGAEFAGTSLTSGGDGTDSNTGLEDRYRANPHLHWGSLRRGYVTARLTMDELRVNYREVPYVTRKGAAVHTRRSFVVESGRPGIHGP